ncbi:MAG TPA: hypothetical protein VJ183_08090 [Chloroflexia bacterium]|nr:hypothetical protein [Chloroflexia bacterium]
MASTQHYNWKRYWFPRGKSINLSDRGYLTNPVSESEYSYNPNPNLVLFEAISHIPCLVLLGEPGIGKTRTIRDEYEATKSKIEESGNQVLWFDLRQYSSDVRLARDLFENTIFTSWLMGEHSLYIFLDSLDECLLRVDTVAQLLVDELQKYPVQRLHLRISCRTAELPMLLENGLKELWGKRETETGIYELAPLRREDVSEAVLATTLDPNEFLAEVERKEVVPLAIKPITLRFLLNIYGKKQGRLPDTQAALYYEGCRRLCEEFNESRTASRLTGRLTADQRMIVAGRIAAVTIFANRYAVWIGTDQESVPDEDMTLGELCEGNEGALGQRFEVDEDVVREVLSTGLFTSRGQDRMGWSHQTYAEYLAAWYITHHKMLPAQIMSLLAYPSDSTGKLVPQLHEVAAWLASMVPAVFCEILKSNPEVLLRCDMENVAFEDRATLVATLLDLYDKEAIASILFTRSDYHKLTHPALDEQLRPYICDKSKGHIVRREAIDIAEACKVYSLQANLADIALDSSELLATRVNAAYALIRFGDAETKAKLKALATLRDEDDPDDELKGCALNMCWPEHMTAEELFSALTPPKRFLFVGSYTIFLSDNPIRFLRNEDLPIALQWVEKQPPREAAREDIQQLVDAIIEQAWNYLDTPGVLGSLAQSVLPIVRHYDHEEFIARLVSSDDQKRLTLFEAILPLMSDPDADARKVAWCGMILSGDMLWMLDQFQSTRSEDTQKILATFMSSFVAWGEKNHLEAIYALSRENDILAKAFAGLFDPVDLGSAQARKLKEDYLQQLEWQAARNSDPVKELVNPPPSERIAALLDKYEAGDHDAWWQLNMEMTLKNDSSYYGDELKSDLTTLPGWKTSDDVVRGRIIEAAKKYVLEGDPETHKWWGKNVFYRPAYAGFRALRLLLQEAPSFIHALTEDAWAKWAPIILTYPAASNTGGQEEQRELVRLAYEIAPNAIIEKLLSVIDQENKESQYLFVLSKIESCWDQRLAEALLAKARDATMAPPCVRALLDKLMAHKDEEALHYAKSLVTSPVALEGHERDKLILAAELLISYADDAAWPLIWPVISSDTGFGQEVVSRIAHSHGAGASGIYRLSDDDLADLYIWLAHQYPHAEDFIPEGAHFVQPRESIARWRDSLLRYLEERGTSQALEALKYITEVLPHLGWLKWTLLRAQETYRRHNWKPPLPRAILDLARNEERRLVQSGEQLLDAIVQSLKRLEAELQGETPSAIDLWNEMGGNPKKYTPKDENRLSDYVKKYLDRDLKARGIVVNREVEIRRGEETDIYVGAITVSEDGVYATVTVVIETKGCWHRELHSAMETQLVRRYLSDTSCKHGLYLVGWFLCNKWSDTDDYRKADAIRNGIDKGALQKQLASQASELSEPGMQITTLVIDAALR